MVRGCKDDILAHLCQLLLQVTKMIGVRPAFVCNERFHMFLVDWLIYVVAEVNLRTRPRLPLIETL
jgi:hypothetical protein